MTVKQKQNLLQFLGLYDGSIDGIWGAKSQKAMNIVLSKYDAADDEYALLAAVADWQSVIADKAESDDWWDEIEFFDRDEFRCKCGGRYCNGFPAEPKEQMVKTLDKLRRNLGVHITIISGLRCKEWNRIQGGVENSQHMFGEASDIRAQGKTQAIVEAELDRIGGVRYHYPIKNSNNVHFDIPKGQR